jgi:hypothetical protein
MFTAYFDASGAPDQLAVVVAGFVSSAELWVEWEAEWRAKLRAYGLECFHNKELSEWPETKRADLISELCRIIRSYACFKTGIAVVNRHISEVFTEAESKEWKINAYAVAGRTAAREMRLWSLRGSGVMPELVYERGDAGQDRLRHLLVSQGYPEPFFRPKKEFTDRKSGVILQGAIPLQAADLLAYQICWRLREFLKTGKKPDSERLCSDLENIPGDYGTVEHDRLLLQKDALEQQDPDILVPRVRIKTNP